VDLRFSLLYHAGLLGSYRILLHYMLKINQSQELMQGLDACGHPLQDLTAYDRYSQSVIVLRLNHPDKALLVLLFCL